MVSIPIFIDSNDLSISSCIESISCCSFNCNNTGCGARFSFDFKYGPIINGPVIKTNKKSKIKSYDVDIESPEFTGR